MAQVTADWRTRRLRSRSMEAKERPPNASARIFTDAFVLAGLSAAAYLLAFAHETGYLSALGVPVVFVEVDMTVVLFAAAVLLLVLPGCFLLADVLIPFAQGSEAPAIRKPLYRLVAYAVFFGPLLAVASGGVFRTLLTAWLILSAVTCIVFFGAPLVWQRRIAGYRNKLEAQRRHDEGDWGVWSVVKRPPAPWVSLSLGISGVLLAFSFFLGLARASSTREFMALQQDGKTFLILRVHGQRLLCGGFDQATRTVGPEYLMVQRSEAAPQQITRMNVGPVSAFQLAPSAIAPTGSVP